MKSYDKHRGVPWHTIRFSVTLYFVLFLSGLAVVVTGANLFTMSKTREQIIEYNDRILKLYIGQTDLNLTSLDKYVVNVLATNEELLILNGETENTDESDQVLAAIRFRNEISGMLQQFYWLHSFYMAGPENIRSFIMANDTVTRELQDSLADYVSGLSGREGWHAAQLNDQYFLLHPFRTGKLLLCAVVSMDNLLSQLDLLDEEFSKQFLLMTKSGQIVYGDRHNFGEKGVQFSPERRMPYTTGANHEYTVVQEASSVAALSAVVVYNHNEMQKNLLELRQIMLLIVVYILLAGVAIFLIIRQIVLKPLKQLQNLSNEVLLGNFDYRLMAASSFEEFSDTNRSINKMLDRIESLRMSVYEEQLKSQQLEIEKLQQQIKPHFLLNSFNLIYNMALEKDYKMIQALSLSLSRYFRYRVHSGRNLVPLSEEMECVRNYLNIQKIRYPDEFDYCIEADPETLNAQVVPLMIQTFAENSIIHALKSTRHLMLTIHAEVIRYGSSDGLSIEITDTGKGYPPEVLRAFKQEGEISTERIGVGINNIRRRLQLVFSSQARLLLSNCAEEGGARTTIITPFILTGNGEGNGTV